MDSHSQNRFANLKHIRRDLSDGGKVVVIDTGALITPEAEAMIQALHSRSIGGIDAHLVKLAQKGVKDFMETYYIGYGDKSIGDCGTATIFIEGVCMLVAKAIQDSMLYNGQEASTRYMNFLKQKFKNPCGSKEGYDLLESLRSLYLKGVEITKERLQGEFPWNPAVEPDQTKWQKAINARAFDVMRSLLPAGAATNLAWHTELRHAADHLVRLRHHPLEEVREVAYAIHEALNEAFPNSFKQKTYGATEGYTDDWMHNLYYYNNAPRYGMVFEGGRVTLEKDSIDYKLLQEYADVLANRPKKTEPPKFMTECGTMRFSFLLDFGSFRDLQRHRSIVQRMPLLTTEWGFEQWYLDQMPPTFSLHAQQFLKEYRQKLDGLGINPLQKQYYIPMGYRTTCRITGDIPALIWVSELRSGISVHPTLRVIAQDIGKIMKDCFGAYGFKLYLDESPDRFNIKRGMHDIVEKRAIIIE